MLSAQPVSRRLFMLSTVFFFSLDQDLLEKVAVDVINSQDVLAASRELRGSDRPIIPARFASPRSADACEKLVTARWSAEISYDARDARFSIEWTSSSHGVICLSDTRRESAHSCDEPNGANDS